MEARTKERVRKPEMEEASRLLASMRSIREDEVRDEVWGTFVAVFVAPSYSFDALGNITARAIAFVQTGPHL